MAVTLLASLLATGCGDGADPPASLPRGRALTPPDAVVDGSAPEAPSVVAGAETRAPSFPEKLASIATETSIYEEPRWGSRRLGYLRAGSVVARAAASSASGPHCEGGWYAIEPRGFVCVGAMATLDLTHPVAIAAAHPPRRDGLPWPYVLSRSPTPLLYARLPSVAEQRRMEPDLADHLLGAGPPAGLPPAEPATRMMISGREEGRLLLGRARPRSGFALLTTVEHEHRRFGLTAELELIPLDRTRLSVQSRFAGVRIGREGLPIAFVRRPGAYRVVETSVGLTPGERLEYREAIPVTETVRDVSGSKFHVARDGSLVRSDMVVLARPMRHPPEWAIGGAKWIDVSIPRQTLVAYEGTTPVYATLVSTGVGGTGDPAETHATIQGAFKIYEKHVTVTMAGREAADPFDLRDVPFVQYFHEGFALHAAYWHDDFGRMRSHGCVNLSPADAAWLFAWTDPRVPEGWHGTMTRDGTIVYVHG